MSASIHSPAYDLLRNELATARKNAGLGQQDLAEILGTTKAVISAFEAGTCHMEVIDLIHWARAVKLDPADLFEALIAVDEDNRPS